MYINHSLATCLIVEGFQILSCKSIKYIISLDMAYMWLSHLIRSSHVHILCIHDSPHMEPIFVFCKVLNYYVILLCITIYRTGE